MTKILLLKINEIFKQANWELTSPKDLQFSSDQVIDAYLKGKQEGLELQQKLVVEKLMSNIAKAGNHTSELLENIKNKSLNPVSAYLRINSWDDYTILVVLPLNEFLDPRTLELYDYISELESKVEEDMYRIQVSLCDTESEINEHYVRSDGFALKHKIVSA